MTKCVVGGILQNGGLLDHLDHLSDSLTGIIVSCYSLGYLGGCIINSFIGIWLGRRPVIWTAMGWMLMGTVLQTSGFSMTHMVMATL